MLSQSLKLRGIVPGIYRFGVKYSTRELLYNSSIDPQIVQAELKTTELQNKQRRIFNHVSNDSNPANIISVKIRDSIVPYKKQVKQPFIVKTVPPPQSRILQSKRQGFVSSIKKMTEALRGLSKKHITTAIEMCNSSHKKVAKLLVPTLYGLLTNARLRGFDLHRLFIDSVLIGKQRRFPSIRYHAKGKSGRMQTDICQVKVIVKQLHEDRFYKQIAEGKIDAGLIKAIKQDLIYQKAPLQQIEKLKDLLSSKGRQQYKMLIQRRIDKIFQQKKASGEQQARKKIQIQVIQEQADRFKTLFEGRVKEISRLKQREAKYLQNTQKKGRY